MHSPDTDLPAEHPGNQLRAKLNSTSIKVPDSFATVMDTARKNGLVADIGDDEALHVVQLFFVARGIDMMPGDEAARVRSS